MRREKMVTHKMYNLKQRRQKKRLKKKQKWKHMENSNKYARYLSNYINDHFRHQWSNTNQKR